MSYQDAFGASRRPILAIDTSSAQGGVAWYDGVRLSMRSWPAERSHTTTVLAEIHHLLDTDGLDPRDFAAVAVAKGLHLATGVPLIGIPTLEATALPFAACGHPIVATIAAGRGRLAWAHFRAERGGVVETRPPRNGTIADLANELKNTDDVIVAGELDDDQLAAIAGIESVLVPPAALRFRQPSSLAEIGWRRWNAGQVDDATALEPVYLSR